VTEAITTLVFGFASIGVSISWLAWRAISLDVTSSNRLVIELRLAQVTALLLVLAAGVYIGTAVIDGSSTGAGLDIALAIGFFVIAALATTWEPSRALTTLAWAWCAHGMVDLGHVVGVLPSTLLPTWYPTACAIYDVCIAGACYLPVFRRS
jgi:hypothetical protein